MLEIEAVVYKSDNFKEASACVWTYTERLAATNRHSLMYSHCAHVV